MQENIPIYKETQLKCSELMSIRRTFTLQRFLYYLNRKFFVLVKLFPPNKIILANKCCKVFCTVFATIL